MKSMIHDYLYCRKAGGIDIWIYKRKTPPTIR